ncbi:class I SAM-dependent methyltransferase [Cupriavidus basilensis]
MIRHARHRMPDGASRDPPGTADAQALPFEPGTFDAVVNAFGMCHLPDPDLALREALRVLKPGGRVAFTVWDVPERAVGFGALYAAVRARHIGCRPAGGTELLPVQRSGCLRKGAARRGLCLPSCRQAPQSWRMATPDQLFEMVAAGTVRASATLRAQSPQAREAIRAALGTPLPPMPAATPSTSPMPALLATAVRP